MVKLYLYSHYLVFCFDVCKGTARKLSQEAHFPSCGRKAVTLLADKPEIRWLAVLPV